MTEQFDPAERLRMAAVALGDRSRFRILTELLDGPLRVGDLVDRLGLAQPLISHHLVVLGEAGWVTKDGPGKRSAYRLRLEESEPIRSMLRLLIEVQSGVSLGPTGPLAPPPPAPPTQRAPMIDDYLL